MNSELQAKNDIVIEIAKIMRKNNIAYISVEGKRIEYVTETKSITPRDDASFSERRASSTRKKSVKQSKKKDLKKPKPKVASSTSSDDCSNYTSSDDCSSCSSNCEECLAQQSIINKNMKKSSEKKKVKNAEPPIQMTPIQMTPIQ